MKKYAYSFDNEIFFSELDSEKEAIDEAISELDLDFVNSENSVFVGEVEDFAPVVDAERVIYQLTDQAYDEANDGAEEYLNDVTEAELDALEKELTKAFNTWSKKYKHEPNFSLIKNVKEIKLD